MTAAFVYQPAAPDVVAATWELAIRLDRHPTNQEAARIMMLAGYRGIEPEPDGPVVVRIERFGRDPTALRADVVAALQRLTSAAVLG